MTIVTAKGRARRRVDADGGGIGIAGEADAAPAYTLRRQQSLAAGRLRPGSVLRLARGCLVLSGLGPGNRSRIAMLLYPGDCFSRETAPPLPGMRWTAATDAMLVRVESGSADGDAVAASLARVAARAALHTIAVNELTAEALLATFLIELALSLGSATPSGCTFELPLSRTDMAGYLGLNPDTVSRLLSRLKAQHLIAMPSRRWTTIADVELLAAQSSLAGAVRQLFPGAVCGAALDAVPKVA